MNAGDAVYPSLRGRAVLITGGASGIGESIVAHFAAQGSRVAFVDIQDEPARALCTRIEAAGHPTPYYAHCDLRDIPALQAAITGAASAVAPFSILVNNAAHDERHAWQDVTVEYWDDRLAVNLRHHFFAIQAIAPMMQALGGGSIINLGSASWRKMRGGFPGYTTSKGAIEGMTRGLARDLGPDNIRVNCVIPGQIVTEPQMARLTPEYLAARLKEQCLNQHLHAPDIARMVLWLAADDSRMCSAQNWIVDGGSL
ncbi:MAG: SDR family NAD(P)-dependent oxidoreductase [Rhodopila sp.]|nr:SDR family NAD(P)-dependent oxidoreductase [Rhodopila sp.]